MVETRVTRFILRHGVLGGEIKFFDFGDLNMKVIHWRETIDATDIRSRWPAYSVCHRDRTSFQDTCNLETVGKLKMSIRFNLFKLAFGRLISKAYHCLVLYDVNACITVIKSEAHNPHITSLPKEIWEEGRIAALSHTYTVKSPLVTMVRPKFAPKSTPSRRRIPKPHYLPHAWTRIRCQTASRSDLPFFTMHWTDRPTDARTYGPTDHPRESLTTIGRCAPRATRPNNIASC